MGQKSTDIDNLKKKKLNSDKENLEKERDGNVKSSESSKNNDKKITRENKMQIREFLDFLEYEKGSSQNTITGYNRDLIQFFLFVKKDFSKVKEQDIFNYVEYISEILTLKEMKQIVDNCPHTPEGMQNKLIIKILIATGSRISETLNLEIKDVENQDYEFIKVLGKGSKYRIIPIYDSLENEIKNYLAIYRPKLKNASESFRIFPNTRREKFWKDLKTIAKNAGIEKNVYPHIFRHSLATILLGNGADVRIVQEILGHSNITTTEIYTHVEKSKLKMIYNNIKLGDD